MRAILPSSDNAIQSSPVIVEAIEPDADVSTVSTENVSNPYSITMRRKSLEVMNEIVVWPKPKKKSS